jgi:transposase
LGERLFAYIREAAKIHGDDTPVILLGNGDGSRTGHFWVYLRDDRSSGDMRPSAVAFRFSADRGGAHPAEHFAGYQGYLQADSFAGYNALYRDTKTKAPRDIPAALPPCRPAARLRRSGRIARRRGPGPSVA